MSDTSSTPEASKPKAPRKRAVSQQVAALNVETGAKTGAEFDGGPPPPARAVSPRALRIALAVSVAINLAIFGVIAGSLLHDGSKMGGRGDMVRDLGFGPFGEALAPNDRRALRDWLKARAPELRSANAQRLADLAAVQAALRAQPFVPAALRAALDGMRGRMESQLRLGHEALTEVILAMPDAERIALANRLERGMRHGRDGVDGRGDKAGSN